MQETALSLIEEQDIFAAIQYLCQQPDPQAVSDQFHSLIRHFYWKKKEMNRVVALAHAGITYALTAATATPDAEAATKLRSVAKAISYDLASFTWDGWAEPGIVLTETHLAFGLEAARANLRLAQELNKGDLPLSRAYWMVGAQEISAKEYKAAYEHFVEAMRYARAAGVYSEELLARGFGCLAQLVPNADNEPVDEELAAIQKELEGVEDGNAFNEQLNNAYIVFIGVAEPRP
jgi:hypothetical protein